MNPFHNFAMIIRTCVCLLALFTVAGRAAAQPPGTPAAPANVPTPADAKPGSINHEDVPYPYPVSYSWTLTGDWPHMAMVRTLLQQMVYTDPVVYDWAHITSRALVIGGEKDGPDFPTLAKHVADTIPGAQLVLVPNAGHVLHFETPEIFDRELVKFLKADAPTRSQAGKQDEP